jgi:hypothetical protein
MFLWLQLFFTFFGYLFKWGLGTRVRRLSISMDMGRIGEWAPPIKLKGSFNFELAIALKNCLGESCDRFCDSLCPIRFSVTKFNLTEGKQIYTQQSIVIDDATLSIIAESIAKRISIRNELMRALGPEANNL